MIFKEILTSCHERDQGERLHIKGRKSEHSPSPPPSFSATDGSNGFGFAGKYIFPEIPPPAGYGYGFVRRTLFTKSQRH
jgi:hypothetical protein